MGRSYFAKKLTLKYKKPDNDELDIKITLPSVSTLKMQACPELVFPEKLIRFKGLKPFGSVKITLPVVLPFSLWLSSTFKKTVPAFLYNVAEENPAI